jgi:hypothetical protein
MSRWVAVGLAAILSLNGLAMLFGSFWWYNAVPGVIATGAFNPHFVRDIGMAYLVTASGLGWWSWRPAEGRPALVGAGAFLTLHATIHVFDASCGRNLMADVIRDLPGVYLPAAVTIWLAVANRPTQGV